MNYLYLRNISYSNLKVFSKFITKLITRHHNVLRNSRLLNDINIIFAEASVIIILYKLASSNTTLKYAVLYNDACLWKLSWMLKYWFDGALHFDCVCVKRYFHEHHGKYQLCRTVYITYQLHKIYETVKFIRRLDRLH